MTTDPTLPSAPLPDLDALTALERGLPPAPWHVSESQPAPGVRTEGGWEVAYTSYADSGPAVAAFIAAARNNWPALLSALTATRAKLGAVLAELGQLHEDNDKLGRALTDARAELDAAKREIRTLTDSDDAQVVIAQGELKAARAEADQLRAELDTMTGVAKALRITVAEMLSGKQHTGARTMVWKSTLKCATEALNAAALETNEHALSACLVCNGTIQQTGKTRTGWEHEGAVPFEHDAEPDPGNIVAGTGQQSELTGYQRQCDKVLPHGDFCTLVLNHKAPCDGKALPTPIAECYLCWAAPRYPLDARIQRHAELHCAKAAGTGQQDTDTCECIDEDGDVPHCPVHPYVAEPAAVPAGGDGTGGGAA